MQPLMKWGGEWLLLGNSERENAGKFAMCCISSIRSNGEPTGAHCEWTAFLKNK